MNIFTRTADLLFDQKKFFAEEKSKKVRWAFLIVLIAGIIAGIISYFTLTNSIVTTANLGPMGGIITVSTVVMAIITVIILWLVISLAFFICLKLFGHSDCKFGGVLRVQGYVVGLTILETILVFLVSFIGTPAPIATLLLALVFYAWSIPIWFFGFKSISTKITTKGVWISILVPVIIMAIITIFTSGIFSF